MKSLIRLLVPPIFYDILKKLARHFKWGTSVYDGFYTDKNQIPSQGNDPFSHENWISYVTEKINHRKNSCVSNQDVGELCLSLLSSLPGPKTIVDFGGGVGMYWPAIQSQNKLNNSVHFVVVDNPANVQRGQAIFQNSAVRFESDFAKVLKENPKIDILNVSSTLQYCLDYQQTLDLLCSSQSKYIIISRHPSPNDGLDVAYTLQNIATNKGSCGQIPVLLLSVQKISEQMQSCGYKLIADYFEPSSANWYWTYSKKPAPKEYLSLSEHSIIFYNTKI